VATTESDQHNFPALKKCSNQHLSSTFKCWKAQTNTNIPYLDNICHELSPGTVITQTYSPVCWCTVKTGQRSIQVKTA